MYSITIEVVKFPNIYGYPIGTIFKKEYDTEYQFINNLKYISNISKYKIIDYTKETKDSKLNIKWINK